MPVDRDRRFDVKVLRVRNGEVEFVDRYYGITRKDFLARLTEDYLYCSEDGEKFIAMYSDDSLEVFTVEVTKKFVGVALR